MTDLSDFGGGIERDRQTASPEPDGDQDTLGVRCDVEGCDSDVVGLDDGWEFDRGTVCQHCIDYRDRHGHWPDEDVETCKECLIDDGAIPHECDDGGPTRLLFPDQECSHCGSLPELTVSDDGLWLPSTFAEASRLIIRTPTKTVDFRAKGSEVNRRIHPSVTAADWAEDYLAGENRTAKIRNERCLPGDDGQPMVGLLIEGGEQHWLAVDVQDGDQA